MSPEANNSTSESIEFINNEVDGKLCDLEEKCNNGYVLGILDTLDQQIEPFDLDLAYDSSTKIYRYVANEFVLNIPIRDKEELKKIGNIISQIANDPTIYIAGNLYTRTITRDEFLIPVAFENNHIIKSSSNQSKKDDVEEIFKFVMDAMGIPIEDWNIKGHIANGPQNEKLYDSFGNDPTNIKNTILAKLDKANISDAELQRDTDYLGIDSEND